MQCACGDYIARLETAGIQPSMSRAGRPYDNAMAESSQPFSLLKAFAEGHR